MAYAAEDTWNVIFRTNLALKVEGRRRMKAMKASAALADLFLVLFLSMSQAADADIIESHQVRPSSGARVGR